MAWSARLSLAIPASLDAMVNLTRIYTRTGDAGKTRLSDNTQSTKIDPRVVAYGSVDETNAVIGVALCENELPARIREMLTLIQNELFDVGADLSNPLQSDPDFPPLRIEAPSVTRLESWCDELSETLPKLRSFILPGGSKATAHLHLARTVCRRAEREAWRCVDSYGTTASAQKGEGGVNLTAVTYLNRLSDLLFIMARASLGTSEEVLWVPGTDRPKPEA